MKYIKLLAVLPLLSACQTVGADNVVELPFFKTSKGDCYRLNTTNANYKYNGKCLVSKVGVMVAFGKNLGVKNLDGLKCEAVGAATRGTFKPPAMLRIPQPKDSSEPLTITCSIGKYKGSTRLYPKKVEPAVMGHLFLDDRAVVIVK
ncbi:hypothetical protein [Pseudovibrio sp. JE062]|uniref:hypothetical protein n=1 Tax=Pseudovibrio sp. JE062 TaxID=439495 RepID=UPI000186BB0C|nr:hypothetical protein [Pseudovibrio sp. JE062]EEA91952.1 hypothetical protein PJE062_3577 [Pseudovibrio sp. JE062]